MKKEFCKTCKFYDYNSKYESNECWRFPPIIYDNVRPNIRYDSWCGEYKEKEE